MNFTEVLFAVMILGIGFIMVAAIFPVAIQQSKSNTDETVAARLAESTVQLLTAHASDLTLPPEGSTQRPPVREPSVALVEHMRDNLIFSPDPRYATTFLFRRSTEWDYAQVFVIAMQVSNRSAYTSADLLNTSSPGIFNPSTFQPRGVYVMTHEGDAGPDRIQFYTETSPGSYALFNYPEAAPGAFVIIADDNFTSPSEGTLNGRIYRLSRQLDDMTTWELAPGYDMAGSGNENIPIRPVGDLPDPGGTPARAFLIGRGHENPGTGNPAVFAGNNQAIAVYTALIPIRP